AAEPEGIRQRVIDRRLTGDIRHVVEIASRVGSFLIDCRRQGLIAQRQYADSGFESPGAAKQMASHGFRGAYWNLLGAIAENTFEGDGFQRVAKGRGCAVGVYVSNVVGRQLGIL